MNIHTEMASKIVGAKNTTYMTHNIHPYPAKFIPQIPYNIIRDMSDEGDVVLDPFCGSGTTLVEARLLGRKSIGVDINPIASLVSKVKTRTLSDKKFRLVDEIMDLIYKKYERRRMVLDIHNFHNKNHWFEKNVRHEIALILNEVGKIQDRALKEFFQVMISAIGITVSNQESDTRYAAKNKHIKNGATIGLFGNKTQNSKKRIIEFRKKVRSDTSPKIYNANATNLNMIKTNSVDLVVTSPPYPNVYDYYLYHKQRMNLLGLDHNYAKENEIGSRLRYSSLKWKIDTFYDDMAKCFDEIHRVVKPKKYVVVVIGDFIIAGTKFNGSKAILDIVGKSGLKIIKNESYELDVTSRTFSSGFRNKGKKEHVITLKN